MNCKGKGCLNEDPEVRKECREDTQTHLVESPVRVESGPIRHNYE